MKILLLFLPIILAGCVSASGELCVKQVEIFQTLEDGALANECKFDWDNLATECSAFNNTIFVLNQEGVEYYDGLKVKTPSGNCAVRDGVYKYISKHERSTTVPKVRFE